MAGTTVLEDGAVYECLRETLAAHGLAISPATLQTVKGWDKRAALRALIEASPRQTELLPQLAAIHANFVERMRAFYQSSPNVSEMPGARSLFQWLKEHEIKIALNTGFSRAIAQTLLDRFGWEREGLIDASVTSDEVERGRPAPDMIQHLMTRLNVQTAAHVAKVGDTVADLWEGRNAGCGLVIGFAPTPAAQALLVAQPHDHLLTQLADLPALLDARLDARVDGLKF